MGLLLSSRFTMDPISPTKVMEMKKANDMRTPVDRQHEGSEEDWESESEESYDYEIYSKIV